MAGCTRRVYEGVEVGGYAKLHQGDAITNLNIGPGNTIHISVTGNIEQARSEKKRLHDDHNHESDVRCAKKTKHDKIDFYGAQPIHELKDQTSNSTTLAGIERLLDKTLRREGVDIVHKMLRASSGLDENVSSIQEYTDNQTLHALESVRFTLHEASHPASGILLTLVDHVRQNSLFPATAEVFPTPSARVRQEAIQDTVSVSSLSNRLMHSSLSGPAQDLVCAFVAMLALLSCETRQSNNAAFISKHSLGKVSLIAGLVTFAVARYFCLPQLVKRLSEWTGGSLVIQDPFLHDLRVPKAHVEHFTLLEAFLRFKLCGTTAEAFIRAGRFNLTIGQRHGPAVHKSDWSTKGRIKHVQRLVMSVFIKKGDTNCLECSGPLSVSDSGRFHCHPCGKAYGNCASLKYLSELVRRPAITSKATASIPQTHQIPKTPLLVGRDAGQDMEGEEEEEEEEESDDAYNTEGIQNIDFKIMRKKQMLPPKLVSDDISETSTITHLTYWGESDFSRETSNLSSATRAPMTNSESFEAKRRAIKDKILDLGSLGRVFQILREEE